MNGEHKMADPIDAVRAGPGEYFLAAENVARGTRFRVREAVYEVVSEPMRWGAGWMANVRVIEGLRPGSEFRAMLHTGTRVDPDR
jgi:hypothetical protein